MRVHEKMLALIRTHYRSQFAKAAAAVDIIFGTENRANRLEAVQTVLGFWDLPLENAKADPSVDQPLPDETAGEAREIAEGLADLSCGFLHDHSQDPVEVAAKLLLRLEDEMPHGNLRLARTLYLGGIVRKDKHLRHWPTPNLPDVADGEIDRIVDQNLAIVAEVEAVMARENPVAIRLAAYLSGIENPEMRLIAIAMALRRVEEVAAKSSAPATALMELGSKLAAAVANRGEDRPTPGQPRRGAGIRLGNWPGI